MACIERPGVEHGDAGVVLLRRGAHGTHPGDVEGVVLGEGEVGPADRAGRDGGAGSGIYADGVRKCLGGGIPGGVEEIAAAWFAAVEDEVDGAVGGGEGVGEVTALGAGLEEDGGGCCGGEGGEEGEEQMEGAGVHGELVREREAGHVVRRAGWRHAR